MARERNLLYQLSAETRRAITLTIDGRRRDDLTQKELTFSEIFNADDRRLSEIYDILGRVDFINSLSREEAQGIEFLMSGFPRQRVTNEQLKKQNELFTKLHKKSVGQ